MRTIIIGALVLLSTGAAAQSWCPAGANWHHVYDNGQTGVSGYVSTVYAGDTVIQGDTAQRCEATLHGYSQQSQNYVSQSFMTLFTRGQGDLVESWNGDSFDTLFNFAAVPGDAWELVGPGMGLTVLDTGHSVIDGQLRRFLVVDLGEFSAGPPQDTIFERLGFLSYYLDGDPFLFDTGLGPLRCYSDSSMNYVAVNAPACDFILSAPGGLTAHTVSFWPNPTQAALWLDLGQPPIHGARYRILDQAGRQVTGGALNSGAALSRMDVSTLVAGLYTLRYEAPSEPAWTARFIKE